MLGEVAGDAPQLASAPVLFEIGVLEPMKQGDGINAYVTYKVVTKATAAGFNPSSSVVRRYSEFAWLNTVLATANPGVIMPPLPDKALVGRFGSDFIEERRMLLERYLRQVAQHPRLQTSEHFKTFLECAHQLETNNVDVGPASARKQNGFMGMFREFQVSAQINLSQSGWMKQDLSLPQDVQCSEMKAYLIALEQQLSAVQKFSGHMVKRHREMATALSEFGLATTLLGNCETETQYLANGLAQLGSSADRLSIIHHEQADQEQQQFEERIKDFLRTVQCAQEAVKGRERTLLAYQTAITNNEAKKQKLSKAQTLTPSNPTKVAEAEAELQTAEEEVSQARERHEQVSQVTREEMQRFQEDKVEYFKRMVMDYVKTQIDCSQSVHSVWQALIPEVENVDREDA